MSEIALSKEAGGTFSEVMKPIMSRYANSGEVNFRVEDKDAAIGKVLAASKAFGQETGRSDIDGIRLEFGDGWFNIRKSNTEPYLRLVAEHLSKQGLYDWLGALESAVASVGGRRE